MPQTENDAAPGTEGFAAMLRKAGMKSTRPRVAVLEVLAGSDAPLAAEDVFLALGERGVPVNLSTVYRSLEALAEKELLSKILLAGDSRTLFEFSHMIHRHYLVCVHCKKIRAIEHCPLESYEQALARQTKYRIHSHKLAVYGSCPECTASNS